MIPSQFNHSPSSYEVRVKMVECLLTKSGVPADIMAQLVLPFIQPYGQSTSKIRSSCRLSMFNLNLNIPKPAPDNMRTEIAQRGWLVKLAMARNNIDALERLVRSGFDLEWQNKDVFTPLMIAIAIGAKLAPQVLIEAGANLHQRKSCAHPVDTPRGHHPSLSFTTTTTYCPRLTSDSCSPGRG
jgi:hypothetical protein